MNYVPFPYLVLDHFLPDELAYAVVKEFPAGPPPEPPWHRRHHLHSRKWALENVHRWKPAAQRAFDEHLYAPAFMVRMERAFRLGPLSADPALKGGGMHLSLKDSYLDIHADFTIHDGLGMRRALNVLLYLTPEYQAGDMGELELWSEDTQRCVVSIMPTFNRAVVFATSRTSFHGHPDPYRGARRLSLAAYYYTPWKDDAERAAGLVTTEYHARPWEYGKRLRKWAGRTARAWGLR